MAEIIGIDTVEGLTKLLTKLATTAGSTAGKTVGEEGFNFLLDQLGLQNNTLNVINEQLNTVIKIKI